MLYYGVVNSSIIFTFYIGSTNIYEMTSPVGSTPSDVSKIHISFLKDDGSHVVKPSFIYETSDNVYSYNVDDPNGPQMQDLYTWLNG